MLLHNDKPRGAKGVVCAAPDVLGPEPRDASSKGRAGGHLCTESSERRDPPCLGWLSVRAPDLTVIRDAKELSRFGS